MPILEIQSITGSYPRRVEFTSDVFRAGRKNDNDLILPEKNISGYHFQIILTDRGFELEDLDSSNGTYLNKYLINNRTLLKDGDRVQAGRYRIRFKLSNESEGTERRKSNHDDIIDQKLEDMDRRLMTLKKTPSETVYNATTTISKLESSIKEAKRAYSRLKALYRSTNMIVSHFDLEDRLRAILKITIQLMECDRGYIMLYEKGTGQDDSLSIRVSHQIDEDAPEGLPSMSIAQEVADTGKTKKIDNILDIDTLKDKKSIQAHNIISAICSPIRFEKQIIGVMYVDNISRPYHYTQEDLTIFEILANQTAVVVEDGRLFERYKTEERLRLNFERYFSPQIVSEIMSNKGILQLGGVRKAVSVLFADIRDFTSIAEDSEPQVLIDSLNEYFKRMLEAIFNHEGCIDKFYGDGLLAFFGAPIEDEKHTLKVYRTAREMQEKVAEYNQYARENGLIPFSIGIGICSGPAIIGNIGSEHHIEYTVVGDTVNVASRLSGEARGGEILISENTLEGLGLYGIPHDTFKYLGEQALKGREKTIKVYTVQNIL